MQLAPVVASWALLGSYVGPWWRRRLLAVMAKYCYDVVGIGGAATQQTLVCICQAQACHESSCLWAWLLAWSEEQAAMPLDLELYMAKQYRAPCEVLGIPVGRRHNTTLTNCTA